MKTARTHDNPTAEALLGAAADAWLDSLARGDTPDIEEYAQRFPAIAAAIHDVFPALRAVHTCTGAAGGLDAPDPALASGQLGDFRLLRVIGRGGMGVVYEAEQISLCRRVALKVLPLAGLLQEHQLQRFRREAQAAAQLHHTNITPVFAVGCERGVHYYAMQYIEGCPLSQIIAELAAHPRTAGDPQSLRTPPSSRAPARADAIGISIDGPPATSASSAGWSQALAASEREGDQPRFAAAAQLGIQAAEALAHAHRCGVIHRDVKPANLLLDITGRLWLSDFGLAHLATAPDLTISGTLLGTLRYMSPEQALLSHGPLDGRSDVYSLGMTLYELLALRPAFDGATQPRLLEQIATRDAPRLRRLNAAIPADLATIVHKAIAKEPGARYASAQALADDLSRYLDHRPIEARPPRPAERLSKWAHRHRAAVRVGILLLGLITIVLGASTFWVVRERSEALHQRDLALAQRTAAEQNLAVARAAVAELISPSDRDGLEHLALIRDEIRRAPEGPGSITDKSYAPVLDRQLANAFMRTGHMQLLLGRFAEAEAAYRRALQFCAESAESADPDHAFRAGVCAAHLAVLLWDLDRSAEAAATARQAMVQWTRAGTATTTAVDATDLYAGARVAVVLARALIDTRDYTSAEPLLAQTLDWTTALQHRDPGEPRFVRESARVLLNRARLLLRTGQRNDAERAAQEGLRRFEALAAAHPTEPAFAAELVGARRVWQQCLAGQETAPSPELRRRLPALAAEAAGAVPWYTEQLAERYRALDVLLFRAGRLHEAQAATGQAWEHLQALLADDPADPRYRVAQGELLLQQAEMSAFTWRLRDARTACDQAATIFAELVGQHPGTAQFAQLLISARGQQAHLERLEYAQELTRLGRESVEGVARAVELARSADLSQLQLAPFALLVHGDYLILGGDYERAVAVIQRAIAASSAPGACYHKSLGCALLGCGRVDEAHAAFLEAAGGLRTAIIWPESACPDPWTAAFFIDRVSAERYTKHHAALLWTGRDMGPYALYYLGLRAELEGRRDDALNAYQRSAAYAGRANAHHTMNWAQYRLLRLQNSAQPQRDAPAG